MPHVGKLDLLESLAAIALRHLDREYPSKLDHVINGPEDLKSPRELHPVFFGSFDWHSSVHGHWLLVRALRLAPGLAQAEAMCAVLDDHFTPARVAAELAYLRQPRRATFERTYGWAWLLKLAAEIKLASTEVPGVDRPARHTEAFVRWNDSLAPLAAAFVERFLEYLPKADYPIRSGTHQNSAFGLALANDYAQVAADADLAAAINGKARQWFLNDADCQAWEPGGNDFLSPALMEAECMRRVLSRDAFLSWLDGFFPRLARGEPAALFSPAQVSDRADGQIAHLDGLNLSRAWCWRGVASALKPDDASRARALDAADQHLKAALPYLSMDYMGEHWLATFALLAISE